MSEYVITRTTDEDELYHYGVPGMKWGHRKNSYTYANGQKPKNTYQKVARSIGGTKFAKNAILKNKNLSASGKRKALDEHAALADEKAYNKAEKKASKIGGQMTYDVATGKYSVSKKGKTNSVRKQARLEAMRDQSLKVAEKNYIKSKSSTARDVAVGKEWTKRLTQMNMKTASKKDLKKAKTKTINYINNMDDNEFGSYLLKNK